MLENDTNTVDDHGPDSGGPVHESIAPIEFEPSAGGRRTGLGGHRWLLAAVLALLAILLGFALFMFTSRSVLLRFDPAVEQLAVDGGWFRLELGDRWLLQPGSYTITARRAGYYVLEQQITVEDREDQVFEFELVKLPGYLNVSTSPAVSARVWIDGEPVGVAPLNELELRPGDYRLSVRAERYRVWEQPVTIEGAEVRQAVEAILEPAWAEIHLTTTPAGATLYVDGEPYGETPLTAEILEGPRSLELRLDGYKSWGEELEVVAGKAIDVDPITLEKSDAVVHVSSAPGGASVTVDGEYRGQTPMQLLLPPGEQYRIGFAKAGYRSNQRLLDVVSGDETSLHARLEPVLGELMMTGTPGDAEVLVDGIPRGRLNERLRLPAHPHRIEVRKEGFETYTTTLTPNPELTQRVEVSLRSHEAIREERMPESLITSTGHALKLVKPSGIFRMGSGRREQGRRSNEFMRQVQLQRPFYVGLREVSNEEFWAFKAEHDSGVVERSTLSLKQQPVVRVSWDDAARFCNWLSEREGLPPAYRDLGGEMVPVEPITTGFRLLSEAEWAYVARYAGHSEGRAALRYPWGDEMPPPAGSGNYGGTEAAGLVDRALGNYRDAHPATAPVGEHPAGPLGVHDLGGNVHEWIHDYYVIHSGQLGNIPVDPLGPAKGGNHVIRGSSWRSASITELRLAFRDEGREGADDIGFRIGRYAE